MFGPDVLRIAEEQVRRIRDNLRIAQSRQKSYADTRRRELVFNEGDYVYLKVSYRWNSVLFLKLGVATHGTHHAHQTTSQAVPTDKLLHHVSLEF